MTRTIGKCVTCERIHELSEADMRKIEDFDFSMGALYLGTHMPEECSPGTTSSDWTVGKHPETGAFVWECGNCGSKRAGGSR